jgi:threonyl-tRNA synthetase
MKITLKDGSVKEYGSAMSVIDIANDISEGLGRNACAGEVDGKVVDLRTVIENDCELSILTFNDEEGKKAYRHTASHVLAEAVKRLYPEAKCAIGPAIDEGFYYDFDTPPFTRDDLDKLEAEIKKIIKEGHELTRFTLPRDEAIKFMEEKGEPYKVELIKDLPEGAEISFYDQGGFVDLCAGPHLMSTKYLKAVKLISSSGAYWRGNEKNKMLTRIYGTAFTKNADMDAYLAHLEDIKLRDHNRLGREMKLFTTVDVIGQGLPLFTPKGTKMIQILQRWIEDLEDNEWGYVRTRTPLMAKSDLYKISGHWDHYMDGMFILNKESEGTKDGKEVMALRPMTCPFQYYVYMNEQRSYRDLPYRMSETSTLFRNEDSGEMHGLTRVRQFTITEGHIVLRPDQAEEELTRCVELANYVMTTLGVQDDVTYRLSKWDPENKEKYEGDEEYWNSTQGFLRNVMDKNGIKYTEADGEAAFYGPKIDIQAKNVY